MTEMKYDAPITGWLRLPLGDGTRVEAEVLFFPIDRPEEIGKLKSLELTGGWINEAGETPKAVFDMLTQRVGRYPPLKAGGPSWTGILLDTNPPDDDHWYYRIAEKDRPKDWGFFRQPGGLIEEGGEYKANPLAENISNLKGGHEYYLRQVSGKNREWIKVFLLGKVS